MTEERAPYGDTPRTDEAAYAVIEFDRNGAAYVAHHAVTRDFARQLERELAEALKERDAAFAMFKCECGTDEACRNLAALHSNLASVKARLDTSDAMLREEWAAHQDTKANLAEARKDAARYRWLRDDGGKSYQETASQPAGILPCIFMRFPSLNESGSYVLRSESADAAIDAAMASDPPAK